MLTERTELEPSDYIEWRRGVSWVTKYGDIIPVAGLRDDHLVNIVRMILRNVPSIALQIRAMTADDMRALMQGDPTSTMAQCTAVFLEFMSRGLARAAPGEGGGYMPRLRDVFTDVDEQPRIG